MKLYYSYIRRLCAYITDRLYQFKRFLLLSIDGLGLSCPVFTKVTGILPVALVCFHFVCFAQESRESGATGIGEIKPLQIGDTIPEELWNLPLQVVNHPDGKDTITLNDYRDKKLIILDFWATWCAPCIVSLKNLQKFQFENPNEFVVIPHTNEEIEFLKQRMEKLSYQVFTARRQKQLNKYFPHRTIPHQIWIKDDKLIHIDNGRNATESNLIATIQDNLPSLEPKYEVLDYDKREPLIKYAQREKATEYQQSYLTGFIKGVMSVKGISTDNEKKYLTFSNYHVFEAYKMKFGNLFQKVILERADQDSLRNLLFTRINYQLIVPDNVSDSLCVEKLVFDIEQGFNLQSRLENKTLPTRIIQLRTKSISDTHLKDNHYTYLDLLINQLNSRSLWDIRKPVYINEGDNIRIYTGQDKIQDLIKDKDKLLACLENNGLGLRHSNMDYKVLRINKVNNR